MSDQNQFDQVKQKLLHIWGVFLAACGRLLENVKKYLKQFSAFLSRGVKALSEKLTVAVERIRSAKTKPGKVKEAPELPSAAEAAEPAVVQAVKQPAESAPQSKAELNREAPLWLVKTGTVLGIIGTGVKIAIQWIWKLRKVIMAVPVVWTAVKFARENMERLPESVGLDIQSTGEFARMITREEAVYWPLGITLFCLLLMFCSKKPLLPWVISIFTLVLPWLIWLTNYYA